MEVYSLRLTDGTIVQISGERYSLDADLYPGAASRYRASFRLICGGDLQTNAGLCALEVVLWDDEAGTLIYTLATTADTPGGALAALDQFDPCAYLPRGHLQPHDLPEIRTRYDERARRFRDEARQFFSESA
jgi:hypothetical protein